MVKAKKYLHKRAISWQICIRLCNLFLNRTNHSGILNGGMIGGRKQSGTWKINARFNRLELRRRIERISSLKTRIHLTCEDAEEFLRGHRFTKTSLIYLDPPYYRAGMRLYLNSYKPSDHAAVSKCILRLKSPWIVSYDDVPEIRGLYKNVKSRRIQLLHTARSARNGDEVLFLSTWVEDSKEHVMGKLFYQSNLCLPYGVRFHRKNLLFHHTFCINMSFAISEQLSPK